MLKSRKLFLLISVSFLFLLAWVSIPQNLTQILAKLSVYNQYRPQQKIYIQLDKPLYASGEDMWFSLYLVDAASLMPDSTSKVVYVELFNSNKKRIQQHTIYSPTGTAHGDFHLPDSLSTGNYVIRAYTNYMKNFDEDFFFVKELSILGKNDLTQTKATSNIEAPIDIQFFPEGGNLLDGAENRVAFKAVDKYGLGVYIDGDVIDETNTLITSFSSEHKGMGVFKITPTFGKHYRARIKNRDETVALPEVIEKGYLLRIMETASAIKVIAYSDIKKYSSEPIRLYIVAQSSGVARFAAEGEILKSSLITTIPKSRLPSGITQITLFDASGIPQCERLVFINHQNTLKFSFTTNHTIFTKRQKVDLDIEVKKKDGNPAAGHFSMTVYDDAKIKNNEKYPNSIATHLLLTADLKGYIEEPGYYLKDTLAVTKSHLDLLMMTHGWRRFTWKTVLSDTVPPLQYYPEQGIVISGRLLKTITNRPAKNSELKILTSSHDLLILKTDSLGRFYSDNLVYFDSTNLFIQTDNAKGKQADMKLQLDSFHQSSPLAFQALPLEPLYAQAFLEQTQIMNQIAKGYQDEKNATLLKEVQVKAKKVEPENHTTKIYGTADATINMKDLPQGYTNILLALQGRVAGVSVIGNPPSVSIRGGGEPLFLLNGMPVDITMVSNIPTNDIESIDILKGANAAIYGGRGGNGVIAIYTKKGGLSSVPSIGVHNLKYPGLYKEREFYSPRYDEPDGNKNLPDVRNVLYWNPTIKTDGSGKAHVSFFTSDVTSHYNITIEGISKDGVPGTSYYSITVK